MTLEIKYLHQTAKFEAGDTVLDALEKAGATMPSSCRAGACQCCLLRLVEGEIPKSSQETLKESLKVTGHFLACICRPTKSIICEPANLAPFRDDVSISELRLIGPQVLKVRFNRPEGFLFQPGQFVTLKRGDGLARSYSISSSANETEYFEIHVRKVTNGRLSSWFHDEAKPGDSMWLEGPKGDCTYYPGNPLEPLTLVGTGTGIAPLFAIAVDAISKGHVGPITIYHGALSKDRFYFVDELKTLAALYPNVRYVPCVVNGIEHESLRIGELKDIVTSDLTNPRYQRVYLCGDPGIVRVLKKKVFLAGVSLTRIHSDPFIGTDL